MTIEAVRGDITAERVDAIVNAANGALARGGGVCGAIFAAAGPELDAACAASTKPHCRCTASCSARDSPKGPDMTETANAAQFEAWNGDNGLRWVAHADERDRVLAPVADALFAVATPDPGARVLDIGCGCGVTTLRTAAQVGDSGSATGIDLSAPMLDVARQRARAAGARNTTFVQADAQTHEFAPGSADLVISRFGTMFFSDADAAFGNIATPLVSGGRLCLATWQPLTANAWLTVPIAALSQHTEPPAAAVGSGMFAQSDPDVVSATLTAAGFRDVTLEATDLTLTLGQTLDGAVDHLAGTGATRALLEAIPEGPDREAALADLRDSLVPHHDDSGVRLGAGIWLITGVR